MMTLDPRETPFHDFRLVYRELLGRIRFPDYDGDVASRWKSWTETLSKRDGDNEDSILASFPAEMPHLFKTVLAAMAAKTILVPAEKRGLKKHRQYRPKEFPSLLKRALSGEPVPVPSSKNRLPVSRGGLLPGSPHEMQGPPGISHADLLSGRPFQADGVRRAGWYFLMRPNPSPRHGSPAVPEVIGSWNVCSRAIFLWTGLYPIFAFTDDFFQRVRQEDYEQVRITKRKGEFPALCHGLRPCLERSHPPSAPRPLLERMGRVVR